MRGVDRIARELVATKSRPSVVIPAFTPLLPKRFDRYSSGIAPVTANLKPVAPGHFLGGITKGSRPNAHAKAAIAGTHLVSEQLQVVSPAPLDDFDSTIVELPIHHGGRPNSGATQGARTLDGSFRS